MSNNQRVLEELLFTLIFSFLFMSSSFVMIELYMGAVSKRPLIPQDRAVIGQGTKHQQDLKEVSGEMDINFIEKDEVTLTVDNNGDLLGCSDCTVVGSGFVDDSQKGNSYKLVGNGSYIDIDGAFNLGGKKEFSLSFLIKPDFDETSKTWKYLFSSNGSVQVFYLSNLNDFRFFLRTTEGVFRVDTNGLKWTRDTWHEITVVYDGSFAQIYWDEKLVGEKPARGDVLSTEGKVLIGSSQTGELGFSGLISKVEFYNKAISKEDTLNIYSE